MNGMAIALAWTVAWSLVISGWVLIALYIMDRIKRGSKGR